LTANWAALIRLGPWAGALETGIIHPTGISAGKGGKACEQPGSKPAINKQAEVTKIYIGLISHSRGNFIGSTPAYASSLYHFQTNAMAIGFY
jgi:hypothetical protein